MEEGEGKEENEEEEGRWERRRGGGEDKEEGKGGGGGGGGGEKDEEEEEEKKLSLSACGPGQHRWYSNTLQAGQSRDQILVGQDFPHPSKLALGPIQTPIQLVLGHSQG